MPHLPDYRTQLVEILFAYGICSLSYKTVMLLLVDGIQAVCGHVFEDFCPETRVFMIAPKARAFSSENDF